MIYSLSALQAAFKTKLYNLNGTAGYMNGNKVILTGITGNEVKLIADNAQQNLYFSCTPTEATGEIRIHFQATNFA